MVNISRKLRKLRKDNKFTLRYLSFRTGISNPALSQMETGKIKNPSVIQIHKLCKVYGISIDSLFDT